jgi:hypothetical protein
LVNANFAVAADNIHLSDRKQVQAHFTHSFQTLPADLKHKLSVSGAKALGNFCSMEDRAIIGRVKGVGSMNTMIEFSAFWVLRPAAQGAEVQAVCGPGARKARSGPQGLNPKQECLRRA